MIRTRSARRLRAALGVVAAAAALTACGAAPAHQGAAAVVGGERISIAQVEARVSALRDGAAAQPGAKEQPGLARHAVSDLILGKVVARALADRQLSVTDTEVGQMKSADVRAVGSDSRLAALLLAKQNVPASGIDDFYRQQIGIEKLAGGQDPTSSAGDAAIRKALADAGTALHIEVNPRYGSWDAVRIGLADTDEDWLPKHVQLL